MKFKAVHNEAVRCIKNNFWKLFFITLLNSIIAVALTRLGEEFDTSIFKMLIFIVSYIITVPLSYGVIISYIKSSREESISLFDFISDGLKSFKRIWCVFGRTILKLILPAILLIIGYAVGIVLFAHATFSSLSGDTDSITLELVLSAVIIFAVTIFYVVKALLYSLTNYILYDNPELTSKEIVEESAIMMKGNRLSLFLIGLYMIILYVILFGICYLIINTISGIIASLLAVLLMIAGSIVLLPYSMGLQVAFYNLLKGTDKTENEDKE